MNNNNSSDSGSGGGATSDSAAWSSSSLPKDELSSAASSASNLVRKPQKTSAAGSRRKPSILATTNHHHHHHHHLMAATAAAASMVTTTTSSTATTSKRQRVKHLVLVAFFVFGLIVCVSSLVCLLMLPTFVTQQISKRLVLKNNSLLLERWSKPNVPMYFKVWLFDVQNPQEVLAKRGTKPRLKEVGPFVFHLKRQKDIVSFAGDNLYYTERKLYHFSPELSCCAINTTVTVPNIPLVAVVDRALSYNLPIVGRFVPRLINRAIQSLREQLFVRKQARELLFEGYEVELLKMVSRIGSLVGLPQTNQKFAILKGRNDTWRPEQDGVWAINTGARDRRLFGRVSSWNSYKQLPFWAAPGCNIINGSDGTLFPPPINKDQPLYIFNQELCRTVNLVYDRPSDIRAIKAYRYVLNPLNFAHTMPSSGASGIGPSSMSALPLAPDGSLMGLPPMGTTAGGVIAGQQQPAHGAASNAASDGGLRSPVAASQAVAEAAMNNRVAADLRPAASETVRSTTGPLIPNMETAARGSSVAAAASPAAPPNEATAANQQRGQWPKTPASIRPQPHQQQLPAERFVQAAQEAQAHSEQRAQSRKNPLTCFCDRKTTNLNGANVCEFDGLIDLSKCTKQAQVIFGSMPHFHQSDPRLLRQVVGMEPNASKHTTYLDIEPNTGLVLGGKRRVQLNLIIKHNNEVEGFENINDMLVPVVWFEESAMIPEEAARKFKLLYTDRVRLINVVLITLFLAALGLLAIDVRLLATHYNGQYFRFEINRKPAAAGRAPIVGGSGSSSTISRARRRLASHESPLDSDEDDEDEDRVVAARAGKWAAGGAIVARSAMGGDGQRLRMAGKSHLGAANDDAGSAAAGQGHRHLVSAAAVADYLRQPASGGGGGLNLPLLEDAGSALARSPPPAARSRHQSTLGDFGRTTTTTPGGNKSVEFVLRYNDTLLAPTSAEATSAAADKPQPIP